MDSQPGDYVGAGADLRLHAVRARTITGRVYPNQGATRTPWRSTSRPPASSGRSTSRRRTWPGSCPGPTLNATRWPFQAAGVPGLDVSGDGRGSNTLTGQFTVTQAVYDASGTLVSFAASFVQHTATGRSAALFGQVAFNATLTPPAGVLANDTDPNRRDDPRRRPWSAARATARSRSIRTGRSSTRRPPATPGPTASPTRRATALHAATWPP